MSDDIQLEEDTTSPSSMSPYMSRRILGEPMEPSLIKIVKRLKLARTDAQAYHVMVGAGILSAMLAVCIVGYFVLGIGNSNQGKISVPKSIRKELPPDIVRKIDAQNTR
jgi:hypothetical protein